MILNIRECKSLTQNMESIKLQEGREGRDSKNVYIFSKIMISRVEYRKFHYITLHFYRLSDSPNSYVSFRVLY
jgi:hypothetical protein